MKLSLAGVAALRGHTSLERLYGFVRDELDAHDRAPVAEHLARCAACRAELAILRSDLELYRSVPSVAPSDERLARILELRAGGERVILPDSDLPPARGSRRFMLVAALGAAAVVAVSTVFSLRTPALGAATYTGVLDIAPLHPMGNETVQLTYTPSASLANAGLLRVRTRVAGTETQGAGNNIPVVTLTTLHRSADGRYRGSFQFPDDASFATIAVEDSTGEQIDSNLERFWTITLGDFLHRPTPDALLAFGEDAASWSWEQSFAVARELTVRFPDRAEGWYVRSMMEADLAGSAGADSVKRVYRPHFDRFDAALRTAPRPSPTAMLCMWRWSEAIGADSSAAYWSDRLVRDHRRSAEAQQVEYQRLSRLNPHERAEGMERQYWDHPDRFPSLAALYESTRRGDGAAVWRWGDRAIAQQPFLASMVATQLLAFPQYRSEALSRLRSLVTDPIVVTPAGDTVAGRERLAARHRWRMLNETASQASVRFRAERLGDLVALGRGLHADGQLAAARDTLTLGLAAGWDPAGFTLLSGVHAALGDTTAAVAWLALAAADPLASSTGVNAARQAMGDKASGAAWDARVNRARDTMRDRVLAGERRRVLPSMPELGDRKGSTSSLRDITGGRPALVAFWSRACGPSVADLATLERVAAALRERGAILVAVTSEPPSAELDRFMRARGLTFPVYHDVTGGAKLSFGALGTPFYYVLDNEGVVRARPGTPAAALRYVAALGGAAH